MRNHCWALILCAAACWGCATIECVKKNETYDVTYTMQDEVLIPEPVEVDDGGNGRGQCGSGAATTGWTMDCLTHDACQKYADVHLGNEIPGGLGPNCLDEFEPAIDDYFYSAGKCDGTNEGAWLSWWLSVFD